MKPRGRAIAILGIWAIAVVAMGGILTSYHQPFRTPAGRILRLVDDPGSGHWRMLHVVSGACGCSQRVMQHLLARGRIRDVTEQVLLVDDQETQLAGSDELVARLAAEGFPVTRIAAKKIPADTGLRGVPLLIVVSPEDNPASPEGTITYVGGYGMRGDQDGTIFAGVRAGATVAALPVLGCAVGGEIRRQADPFGLKYPSALATDLRRTQ